MSVCQMDDSPWCSEGTCEHCDAARHPKKSFLVVGSDGMYEQSFTVQAKSFKEVTDELLKDIAEGYGGDWEPTRYQIYELAPDEPVEVDDEQVEAAIEVRTQRENTRYKKQQEDDERRTYERLKRRFESEPSPGRP